MIFFLIFIFLILSALCEQTLIFKIVYRHICFCCFFCFCFFTYNMLKICQCKYDPFFPVADDIRRCSHLVMFLFRILRIYVTAQLISWPFIYFKPSDDGL